MGFNKDKKKKLADLLAKRRAAAVGEGMSTPIAPSTSATPAPHPTEPGPVVDRPEGVVAIEKDNEETCTDLVYKRQRVGEAVAPSTFASGGTRPSWTTPLAPPPRFKLLFTRVGERVPLKAKKCLLPPSFPCCSNDYSTASKTRK